MNAASLLCHLLRMPFTVICNYTCHDISSQKLIIINILDKYID